MKIPHKYDHRGSLESGNNAETLFDKTAKNMGYKVIKATSEQDMEEKWDRLLYKGDDMYSIEKHKMYRVEIKGLKRIKFNERVQDKYTWIELHGVGEEDDGWLYGGMSDIIAFERTDKFILVKRLKLIDLVNKLVDFGRIVEEPEEAEYKVYHRSMRPFEKSTLIELDKIQEVACGEWNKQFISDVGW